MKKILFLFLLSSFVFFGFIPITSNQTIVVYANDGVIHDNENSNLDGDGVVIKLENPLGSNTNSLPELVQKILEIALKVGVPLIALAIIYTGYLFIAAQGNPEKLQKAKQSLIWVVIGSGILLGAYVIANALVGTINAIRGN